MKLTTHFQLALRSRKFGSIYPLPHTPSWRSAYLVKHGDNFIFFLFYNNLTKSNFICCSTFISLADRPERNLELVTVNRSSWTEYVARKWERQMYVDNDASLTFVTDMRAYPVNLKRSRGKRSRRILLSVSSRAVLAFWHGNRNLNHKILLHWLVCTTCDCRYTNSTVRNADSSLHDAITMPWTRPLKTNLSLD
jgi:hypothetical protein